jgi:hypothetical protein
VSEQTTSPHCAGCGWSWSLPIDEALDVVADVPARVGTALDRAGLAALRSPAAGVWSPSSYAWHLVDVLRIGTERLWTIALDPASGLPGWDQDDLAAVRRYADLSSIAVLRALRDAAATWLGTARSVPLDASAEHDEEGPMTAADVIRRCAHEAQHHLLDIERALR